MTVQALLNKLCLDLTSLCEDNEVMRECINDYFDELDSQAIKVLMELKK